MIRRASPQKSDRFLGLFPMIMMILDPYAFTTGGINICDVLIVVMAAYFLLSGRIAVYTPLLTLLGLDLVLTLISFVFTDSHATNLLLALKIVIVFLLYLTVYSSIWVCDIKASFLSGAEKIGLLCAALAILQFVFASAGYNFYDGRLFLPLGEGSYFGGLFDRNTGDIRVHSFFEEPSYLAFFEIPITTYLLKEKKYLYTAICGLACVLSGSMTGMIGLALSLVVLLLFDSSFSPKRKLGLATLIVLLLLCFVLVYRSNADFKRLIDYYIDRGLNLEASSKRANSSFSQRLMGNVELFGEFPTFNKFFGVGFNQYAPYFGLTQDYSNDIVSNLMNFGYLGMAALIVALIKILKNAGRNSLVYFLTFLLLLAIDHSWFGAMFFYMLTWIVVASDSIKPSSFIRLKT